jgi:dynein heavy chain, axonemal
MWRRWYEDNEPESIALPDYENRILEQADTIGPFYKLLLVRSLRMDRTILTCKEFIRSTAEMGPAYVEPVTDTIEMIYDDMVAEVPVIFLLSIGKRDSCLISIHTHNRVSTIVELLPSALMPVVVF